MDPSLIPAIKTLDVNDTKRVDSLVASVRNSSLEQPRQIIALAKTKDLDEETLERTRLVLLQLGDVAFAPILDMLTTESPDALVWDLQAAMGFHRANQARLLRRLETLIGDKRQLTPREQGPFTEEKIPNRRVCDEAYLMMRQLLAMEDEESAMVNARIFIYSMTDAERDREIMRLVKSKTWVALTEQAGVPPEERK